MSKTMALDGLKGLNRSFSMHSSGAILLEGGMFDREEYRKKWRKENKAYFKKWAEDNREKIREATKKWKNNNNITKRVLLTEIP